MTHHLQLVSVCKVYDKGTPAVLDFNLEAAEDEFVAFVALSCCGKTMTQRMIAAVESITLDDLFIREARVNCVSPERRPTAMIFPSYALFPHMTVRDNVRFVLDVKGIPPERRNPDVDRIFSQLCLSDIVDAKPDRMSGRQKQRIAVAPALAVEPDVLILDGPLGALEANLR